MTIIIIPARASARTYFYALLLVQSRKKRGNAPEEKQQATPDIGINVRCENLPLGLLDGYAIECELLCVLGPNVTISYYPHP